MKKEANIKIVSIKYKNDKEAWNKLINFLIDCIIENGFVKGDDFNGR
jgi:hypothetical protein